MTKIQVTPVEHPSEFDAVVTNMAGIELVRHRASSAMSVADMKAEVEKLRGLPAQSQRLVAGGTVLSDAEILQDYCDSDAKLALMLVVLPEELTRWLRHLGKTPRYSIADVFRDMETDIQECFECALCAVQKDGEALKFASPMLQNDRRVVLAAVSENGASLQFASEVLQSDRAVVSAALQNCGMALQYAPKRFRQDRSLVDLAVRQDLAAVNFVEDDLRSDMRFRLFYFWLWLYSKRLWIYTRDGERKLALLYMICFVMVLGAFTTGIGLVLVA